MHIYLTLQSKAKRGNQVQPKKEKIEIASTDWIVDHQLSILGYCFINPLIRKSRHAK